MDATLEHVFSSNDFGANTAFQGAGDSSSSEEQCSIDLTPEEVPIFYFFVLAYLGNLD